MVPLTTPALTVLANLCGTSTLATAIRYVRLNYEPMAVVVSERSAMRYAFLSDELKEFGIPPTSRPPFIVIAVQAHHAVLRAFGNPPASASPG